MILTTDFHTHILPGIDDGSQSLEESVEMIRKEQADGVDRIILTPHFYPQQMYPDAFIEKRQQAMDQLLGAFPADTDIPQLILGAEILFYPGISQWEQLNALTIGETKYILIEMPFRKWADSDYAELKLIHDERGLTPILAHIERYLPSVFVNKFINRITALPVLLQSNCDFITNKHTQHLALKLIRTKAIHLIGSDCHGSTWRSPTMAQAREILLNNMDKHVISYLSNTENLFL